MDIANIYNLPDEVITQYKDNPFPDNEVRPGTKEFADKFKKEIIALPTPYVIALEDGYGMGKTHFITRFCEYLKKQNSDNDIKIEAVYLNIWENDHIDNPFPIIAAQIISTLNPAKELQKSITSNSIKITNNMLKFGAKIFAGLDIGDIFPNPKQEKDDIKEFKKDLQKLIIEKGGKVVLVIDELDRCKPDYAVKTLETIKHFFDIEGLFIILTTSIDFMNSICEAHYGHPNCKLVGEGYIQKFVQSARNLNSTSKEYYLFIVKSILNEKTLPERAIYTQNSRFINSFAETISDAFFKSGLSIRKTIDTCKEIKMLIHNNENLIWKDKIYGFPEHIIIKYLKAKNVIKSGSVSDPEVQWNFNSDHNIVPGILEKLL